MPSLRFRNLSIGVIVASALWCLWPDPVAAQPEFSGLPPPGAPTFELDYAAFRAGADSVRVEVYYQISNPRLSYLRRARRATDSAGGSADAAGSPGDTLGREFYIAAYEMSAVLKGDKDPQVATVSRRENYALETFEETRSPTGYLLNVLTMTVVPEDYELEVTLTDRVSGSSYSVRRDVELTQFRDAGWLFGGPEFFDPEAIAPPDNPAFWKTGRGIVPNVKRSFTGLDDRLAFYLEIDRDRAPEAERLIVDVYQQTRRKHFTDTVAIDPGTGIVPLVYQNPLPGLATGEARLRLQALGSDGRQLGDQLEAYYWIDWTVSAMVQQDWDEAVDMLVHIAGHGELKTLREAPEEQRAVLFEAFWESRDPTPDTPENEWKQEYYRRIRFANLQFTNAFNRGWRTDFGTVYIRYGEPDEIERYPFERGQKPYQIWNYYGQNRKFVFVDVRGNGDYELQYPYDGLDH